MPVRCLDLSFIDCISCSTILVEPGCVANVTIAGDVSIQVDTTTWCKILFEMKQIVSQYTTSIIGSAKTTMFCVNSVTCSPQLPEQLTVRNSQKQKPTIAKAAGLCTPFKRPRFGNSLKLLLIMHVEISSPDLDLAPTL